MCTSNLSLLAPLPQMIQGKLADMYTVSAASRAFVYRTAADADAGRANRKDCAAVILYAAENATRIALDAIQAKIALSAAGFMADGQVLHESCAHTQYFKQ